MGLKLLKYLFLLSFLFLFSVKFAFAQAGCTTISSGANLKSAIDSLPSNGCLILGDGEYKPSSQIDIATNGVTIKAANRGGARINGINVSLGQWNWLLRISGDNIKFDGIEVLNSAYYGIVVSGSNNVLSFLNVHDCQGNGVLVNNDDEFCESSNPARNNIVEDSHIHDNVLYIRDLVNAGQTVDTWPVGLSAARCPHDTIFRRNVVHDNWGEGISTFDAYNTLIEDNISYNNYAVNIYLDCAPGTIIQRNLIYNTGSGSTGYGKAPGIGFCDERPPSMEPPSRNVKIVNNMIKGGNGGFYAFVLEDNPATGLKNFLIAHNTFIGSDYEETLKIRAGVHENSRIENNIFVAGSGGIAAVPGSGISFSHNLWSQSPGGSASGTGDVIGDPLLAKTGSTSPGQMTADWFKLTANSAAINKAIVLSDVTEDYFRNSRGTAPDIGAHEYGASGATSTPTPTPSVICLGADTTINGDDLTAWAKSYSIISNVLKFAELISHWGENCRH